MKALLSAVLLLPCLAAVAQTDRMATLYTTLAMSTAKGSPQEQLGYEAGITYRLDSEYNCDIRAQAGFRHRAVENREGIRSELNSLVFGIGLGTTLAETERVSLTASLLLNSVTRDATRLQLQGSIGVLIRHHYELSLVSEQTINTPIRYNFTGIRAGYRF